MRRAFALDRFNKARGQRRIGGARIDHQAAPAGNHIGGAGFDGENADGGDEIVFPLARQLFGDAPHRRHRISGGHQRVPAQVHRRRAGMVGGAVEDDLDSPDADDGCDDADIERLRFKHDALLDMQLQERLDVGTLGVSEPIGIAAHPPQCVAQSLASGLGQIKHRRFERTRHPATADAGKAVFARLLGEKIDDFDAVLEALAFIAQRAHDFQAVATPAIPSKRPPDGTVSLCEPTAMTPSEGLAPSSRPIKLPAASMRTLKPRLVETPGEKAAAFKKQRAEGAAGVGTRGIGNLGQRHHVGPETVGIERQIGCGQIDLPLSAPAAAA